MQNYEDEKNKKGKKNDEASRENYDKQKDRNKLINEDGTLAAFGFESDYNK